MYNVLICDDQPDIVNALKIYLTPEGYNLFEAFTGAQAVEIAKNNDIHLILLDVMMPVMDGITATSKIREFSNAPIILLTAKSETEDKVLGLNVGADDYITKPFVPVEVLARVRSQLRRYAQLGSRPEDGQRQHHHRRHRSGRPHQNRHRGGGTCVPHAQGVCHSAPADGKPRKGILHQGAV